MNFEPSTRRVNQRHDVEIPAVIHKEDEEIPITITNISVGGLYIAGSTEYKNKEIINIEFSIPNLKNPIRVDCMVRWIERDDNAILGIGVQFIGLKAKEVWGLTRFFSTLQSQEI